MIDMHRHGKLSRFFCWAGLHPPCCVVSPSDAWGRCLSCGKEELDD